MDIANDIIQLIKQNLRVYHDQLTEDQNNRLAQLFPTTFNFGQFESDFTELFELWKRETLIEVGSRIGDLRKQDLGELLNINSETFEKDVLNLPRFELIDNDNTKDKELLREYDQLRTSIINRCHLYDSLRAYSSHDVASQQLDSIFLSTHFPSWTDEISSELKNLIQTLEGLLKSWPTLDHKQKTSIINFLGNVSESLEDIVPLTNSPNEKGSTIN